MRLVTGQPGGTLRAREVETRLSGNSYFQWLVNEDGCIQIAVERQMRGGLWMDRGGCRDDRERSRRKGRRGKERNSV